MSGVNETPEDMTHQYHNSIYFYSLSYTNKRFGITRDASGFLEMPVKDRSLNFAHILTELELAKNALKDEINLDYPGCKIDSYEIKVININRLIGEKYE
jgi:hypothetical protein